MYFTMAYLLSISRLNGHTMLFSVYAKETATDMLNGKQLVSGVRSIKLATKASFRLFLKAMQSWLKKQAQSHMPEA